MRLVEYLTPGREKVITKERADKLLNGDYNDAYNSWSNIYRGITTGSGKENPYFYINPGSSLHTPRKSANTLNFYTLIIDNSSNWNKYPKRSKSIICTTDAGYTSNFGDAHYVYPMNGSDIGVCPSFDMWESFKYVNKITGSKTLAEMNDIIFELLDYVGINAYEVDGSYLKMADAFKKIDKYKHRITSPDQVSSWIAGFNNTYLKSGKRFIDFLDDILSPNKNGFTLMKAGEVLPKNREVWISAPCIMVRLGEDYEIN